MRDIIEAEAEYIFERMRNLGVIGGTDYAYYQGRIDAMAWVLRQLEDARV
jgi:hypothetical protein